MSASGPAADRHCDPAGGSGADHDAPSPRPFSESASVNLRDLADVAVILARYADRPPGRTSDGAALRLRDHVRYLEHLWEKRALRLQAGGNGMSALQFAEEVVISRFLIRVMTAIVPGVGAADARLRPSNVAARPRAMEPGDSLRSLQERRLSAGEAQALERLQRRLERWADRLLSRDAEASPALAEFAWPLQLMGLRQGIPNRRLEDPQSVAVLRAFMDIAISTLPDNSFHASGQPRSRFARRIDAGAAGELRPLSLGR
jgi:hypothetical protein